MHTMCTRQNTGKKGEALGLPDSFICRLLSNSVIASKSSDSLLSYSYDNLSSTIMRTAIRKLASLMASLLITYINIDFEEINLTAADLGFLNY